MGSSRVTHMPSTTDTSRDHDTEQRRRLAFDNGGNDLDQSVKVHWKDAAFQTWEEAVTQLARGLTVTVRCNGNTTRGGWGTHKVRFNPDGSIDLLHHPDAVIDREAELMLAGLGAITCTCVATAMYLPERQLAPRNISTHNMINVRLRTLYAAVAWAQHPDTRWGRTFGDTYLRYGITPSVIAEWTEDGWDPDTALRFQQTFTPLWLANEWRAVGNVTLRAAKLAGRGESPDTESRWTAVGFTPSRSAKWRVLGIPPAEAFEWDQCNVTPSLVNGFKRAAAGGGVPIEVVKQWCASGVPASKFHQFYERTNGNLTETLEWTSRKIPANVHYSVHHWNLNNPRERLTAEQVAGFVQVKSFPHNDASLMAYAIRNGVTPREYEEAVASLRTPQGAGLRQMLVSNAPADKDRAEQWKFTSGAALERALMWVEGGWASDVSRHILAFLA